MAIPVIIQVLAVLFSCLSLLELVNAALTWFGERVGIQNLTVQVSEIRLMLQQLTPQPINMGIETVQSYL
jgi:nucleoside permease NupC